MVRKEVAISKIRQRWAEDKSRFTVAAETHIMNHGSEQEIPPLDVHQPSDGLRLRLEKFPDIAQARIGEAAVGMMITVDEPGADPLVVRFTPK